ncbi:chaplin family protein [Streptomyces sp. NPDC048521]|uniref:chaplin family protein n=1 Tax=Streptomyces sp. NPDC048521 TaxID=3365566 RepID=UPI003723E2EE
MLAVAAASGAMAVAGPVHADSAADAAAVGSPGLISGNTVHLPLHVPVNVCGNTVNVAGLLNPALGNKCANEGGTPGKDGKEQPTAADQATAQSVTKDSPGVVSGNGIQLPVHLPVNVSGNTVDVVGIGNPVFGNTSTNGSTDRPDEPSPSTPPTRTSPPDRAEPQPHTPPAERTTPKPVVVAQPPRHTLAHTGTDSTVTAVAASVASLLGGTVLYRGFRSRTARREG